MREIIRGLGLCLQPRKLQPGRAVGPVACGTKKKDQEKKDGCGWRVGHEEEEEKEKDGGGRERARA